MTRDIAIAGLAGLTCAKSLVDAGFRVTVLEQLPYLGGRASNVAVDEVQVDPS